MRASRPSFSQRWSRFSSLAKELLQQNLEGKRLHVGDIGIPTGSDRSSSQSMSNPHTFTMKSPFWLFLLLLSHLLLLSEATELVLTPHVMSLVQTAGHLSEIAYDEDPSDDSFLDLQFFDQEPDQAIVAQKDGVCYAAFRGTTLTWDDWSQNLKLGNQDIEGCSTRIGFYEAYNTNYRTALEEQVRKCAKACKSQDDCVVLTGHSQGGAIANVAALYLHDLNPYVITFGQPPTVDAPCPLISSERYYRFINTKQKPALHVGLSYDPVPFAPGLGADFFGYMILLSDDTTGVAFLGLDAHYTLRPFVSGVEAHSMRATPINGSATDFFPGYNDRIDALIEKNADNKAPLRTNGYQPGTLCSEDDECETKQCNRDVGLGSYPRCIGTEYTRDDECDTDRCDHGLCLPKLGSCQPCNENSDCASGICSWKYKCTNMDGLVDNQCDCFHNADCDSGRCEGFTNAICEARLAGGSYCNEHSDCLSDRCTWRFKCTEPKYSLKSQIREKTISQSAFLADFDPEREDSLYTVKKHFKKRHHINTRATEDEKRCHNEIRWYGILALVVLGIVGYVAARWYQNRKRSDYERIPATLNV